MMRMNETLLNYVKMWLLSMSPQQFADFADQKQSIVAQIEKWGFAIKLWKMTNKQAIQVNPDELVQALQQDQRTTSYAFVCSTHKSWFTENVDALQGYLNTL